MRTSIPNHCERCGEQHVPLIGSYFDESMICPRCEAIERQHPDFKRARDTEMQQVRAGNYNYPGIGLPEDLAEQCRAARNKTGATT